MPPISVSEVKKLVANANLDKKPPYEGEPIFTRSKLKYASIEQSWESTYKRRQEQLHQGLGSSRKDPYQTVGVLHLDNESLLISALKINPKKQKFQKTGKEERESQKNIENPEKKSSFNQFYNATQNTEDQNDQESVDEGKTSGTGTKAGRSSSRRGKGYALLRKEIVSSNQRIDMSRAGVYFATTHERQMKKQKREKAGTETNSKPVRPLHRTENGIEMSLGGAGIALDKTEVKEDTSKKKLKIPYVRKYPNGYAWEDLNPEQKKTGKAGGQNASDGMNAKPPMPQIQATEKLDMGEETESLHPVSVALLNKQRAKTARARLSEDKSLQTLTEIYMDHRKGLQSTNNLKLFHCKDTFIEVQSEHDKELEEKIKGMQEERIPNFMRKFKALDLHKVSGFSNHFKDLNKMRRMAEIERKNYINQRIPNWYPRFNKLAKDVEVAAASSPQKVPPELLGRMKELFSFKISKGDKIDEEDVFSLLKTIGWQEVENHHVINLVTFMRTTVAEISPARFNAFIEENELSIPFAPYPPVSHRASSRSRPSPDLESKPDHGSSPGKSSVTIEMKGGTSNHHRNFRPPRRSIIGNELPRRISAW
eukprot:Nk52_evm43s217 gene=Nk52_evmTU43s217